MKFGHWFIIHINKRSIVNNTHLGLFGIMVLVCGVILSPVSISAQTHQQTIATNAGTLKVGISTEPASPKPDGQSKLKIDFLNPQTNQIQEHIDYTVLVTNNGNSVFGPIPLTHTSLGTATIPVQFKDGENKVVIDIQGILFRPIPSEKATFSIIIGDRPVSTQPKEEPKVAKPTSSPIVDEKKSKDSKPTSVAKDKKDPKKDIKDKKKDVKKDSKKRHQKEIR
jgi:hypothetical protein